MAKTSRLGRAVIVAAALTLIPLGAGGCGYNEVITQDENVKSAWAEVQNQYQRRADLVPNLVNTVKGSASFEKETLESVVQARAKVGQLQVNAGTIDDPQKFKAFQDAQGELSSALSRLMVVVEKYPDLKSTAAFQDLQAQLEGTENRIAVARGRYIDSVAQYNKVVLHFPSSIGAGMRNKKERPTFEATAPNADRPPEVKF
jgi:LemA protein